MHRTHTCGALRSEHVGMSVVLAGWIEDIRDMGGLYFLTLRDRYGVTQITTNDLSKDLLHHLHIEYCIKVVGTVVARPRGQENLVMPTGAIELAASSIEILNQCKELPFPIRDEPNTSEEWRMKHRFLDLRRGPVMKNLVFRAQMNHFTRNWFVDHGFLEIQTPLFTVSSPEGARDYIIPSRVNPGKFYALPQAPQQYKQLLMVGGIDKYFQIAPCFRDEDPRADRHSCEFYQIDAEMSFVEQDDIFAVGESYIRDMVAALVPNKRITVSFDRIPYHQAQALYGSDKPDLRFGMQFFDLSSVVASCGFSVFADAVAGGGVVKAVVLSDQTMSRKEIDAMTEIAKQAGAGGLAYFIVQEQDDALAPHGVRSPIAKFFEKNELEEIVGATGATIGDMIFFGAGPVSLVNKVLNKVRLACRDQYQLVDQNALAFAWITDFPFYEYDEGQEQWDFGHNPFSAVVGGVEALRTQDFADVQTTQYDMVLNGYEILSGSIRNHDPAVLVAAFEKVGLSERDVKERFGAMYEAFQYGAPPHGGFAFGFDRLMMILLDEPNIRECYAFPKSGRAEDVMMGAPSFIDQHLLDELHVAVIDEDDNQQEDDLDGLHGEDDNS